MSEELKLCPHCGSKAYSFDICTDIECSNIDCGGAAKDSEAWNARCIPEGYSLVKNSALVEKGQPMPQTLDEWHNLAAGYDKAMLADKAEISRLKSELNNAKQQLESLRGKQ